MRASSLTALLSLLFLGFGAACSGAQTAGPETVAAAPEAAAPAAIIPDGRTTSDGVLLGGQPTPAQLEALHADGYRTVINLQTEDEEGVPATLEKSRAVFGADAAVHLPVGGIPGVNLENASKLAEALAAAKERGGKVVLHCRSGGRAAALWALARHQSEGISADDTIQAAKEAGLEKQVMLDHLAELLEE